MIDGGMLGKKCQGRIYQAQWEEKKNLFSSMMFSLATKAVHYDLIKSKTRLHIWKNNIVK
jgi:hypothetical protein